MPHKPFNFRRQYQLIGELLRPIDLESALLFCSHVLAAWRDDECHIAIRDLVNSFRLPPTPFLGHLAAKECLLRCLGQNTRKMGTKDFERLRGLLLDIQDHDPAVEDPDWVQSNPNGFCIRYFSFQQPVVRNILQTYGLAVALFTKDLPVGSGEDIDIPSRIEQVLQMSPLVFMRAGFAAAAVRMANSGGVKMQGTISSDLIERHSRAIGDGVRDAWPRFLRLVSGTHAEFKRRSHELAGPSPDPRYALYQFNMLKRFPMIDIGGERFITVDPQLLRVRTSLGMCYDLLEADGSKFTPSFGHRFANLVGDLARNAFGTERVWSEPERTQQPRALRARKRADHALIGDAATILIECKAFKPTRDLLMTGDSVLTDTLVGRVADAIGQLTEHACDIRDGKWASLGLTARACFGIIVIHGEIPTANGGLFRDMVLRALPRTGQMPLPYMLLSLSEFDSFLRLVELGHAPDVVIAALTESIERVFPGIYETAIASDPLSRATRRRCDAFLATLPTKEGGTPDPQ